MAISACLTKMGFSPLEQEAMLGDSGDANSIVTIREHLDALEAERADILKQATPTPAESGMPEVDNPGLLVATDSGAVPAETALAQVNAEIEKAKQEAPAYEAAAACAIRG